MKNQVQFTNTAENFRLYAHIVHKVFISMHFCAIEWVEKEKKMSKKWKHVMSRSCGSRCLGAKNIKQRLLPSFPKLIEKSKF